MTALPCAQALRLGMTPTHFSADLLPQRLEPPAPPLNRGGGWLERTPGLPLGAIRAAPSLLPSPKPRCTRKWGGTGVNRGEGQDREQLRMGAWEQGRGRLCILFGGPLYKGHPHPSFLLLAGRLRAAPSLLSTQASLPMWTARRISQQAKRALERATVPPARAAGDNAVFVAQGSWAWRGRCWLRGGWWT